MKLRDVGVAWDRFLFSPVSSLNIAVLRILWGLVTLASIFMMLPERHLWFAADGILGNSNPPNPAQLNLMSYFVSSHAALDAWFVALISAIVCVTIGLYGRISVAICWVMITSMAHTNSLVIHSGDNLIRLMAFFLILSPASACLSLDARRQGRAWLETDMSAPWAQRIIQIQLCIVYATTAWWKLKGMTWNDGSAVGIVLNLLEFKHLPLPDFVRSAAASPALTGFAVTFELLFPILVWFKDTRKLALFAGLLLHIGMEWSLNIQLFQPTILSMYVLFLSPETLKRALTYVAQTLFTARRRSRGL